MTPPAWDRSWDGSWRAAPRRREVVGGVTVAKPGVVREPAAVELLEQAAIETEARVLARGRTYARSGQVIGLLIDGQVFVGQVQGSDRTPYEVALARGVISGSDRMIATCDCPYGCDFGWCKHAAALAYAAAALLDRDLLARAAWSREPPTDADVDAVEAEDSRPVDQDVLALLRTRPGVVDAAAMMVAADLMVPHPWSGARPHQ